MIHKLQAITGKHLYKIILYFAVNSNSLKMMLWYLSLRNTKHKHVFVNYNKRKSSY